MIAISGLWCQSQCNRIHQGQGFRLAAAYDAPTPSLSLLNSPTEFRQSTEDQKMRGDARVGGQLGPDGLDYQPPKRPPDKRKTEEAHSRWTAIGETELECVDEMARCLAGDRGGQDAEVAVRWSHIGHQRSGTDGMRRHRHPAGALFHAQNVLSRHPPSRLVSRLYRECRGFESLYRPPPY